MSTSVTAEGSTWRSQLGKTLQINGSFTSADPAKSVRGAYDSPSSIGFAPSVFVDITGYLDKELDV